MKFELDYVEKLITMLNNSDLTEIKLEDGTEKIILKKHLNEISAGGFAPIVHSTYMPKQEPPAATSEKSQENKEEKKGTPVVSPMVGTFYKSPAPNAKPFIEIGQTIATGQIVCIIEAMKLMNEIESDVSGRVIEICVEDGQPVEYGQVLMYVE